MPKKIRRSNSRLKKTNRKGRKTANRNRLRKFVGGAIHWVAGARPEGGFFSNDHIVTTKQYIDFLSGRESSTLLYRLISPSFRDELKRLAMDQMWRVLEEAEEEWQSARADAADAASRQSRLWSVWKTREGEQYFFKSNADNTVNIYHLGESLVGKGIFVDSGIDVDFLGENLSAVIDGPSLVWSDGDRWFRVAGRLRSAKRGGETKVGTRSA